MKSSLPYAGYKVNVSSGVKLAVDVSVVKNPNQYVGGVTEFELSLKTVRSNPAAFAGNGGVVGAKGEPCCGSPTRYFVCVWGGRWVA
jgi:hypothetical protein